MKNNYNLLGRIYPFFLNNADPTESHYLYQVYSPGLTKDLVPLISLTKISENTLAHPDTPNGNDLDLISICSGCKSNAEKAADFISNIILKREENKVVRPGKFPTLEIQETTNLTKSLIVGLRDSLRWKNYRFIPGRFIDILWTATDFVLFEIYGDNKNGINIKPVAAYRNTDTTLKNPLNVDLESISTWKEPLIKASDINHAIKTMEWNSFTRRPF